MIFLNFFCNYMHLILVVAMPWAMPLALDAANLESSSKPCHVLVSVAPHKFFVNKIAGDTVTVGLMVPAGASAHTYEPTPKEVIAAGKANLWFCIGESFEARASRAMQAYNSNLIMVDLRQGVDMINADPVLGTCTCHHNSQDLHIWLSPRQAKIQATTIAKALSQLCPQYAAQYQSSLDLFLSELEALDQQISSLIGPIKNRYIMVSHPSYAYFCRDYQLRQLSIEFEGKDPSPRQLNTILNRAREAMIKKIFIQVQYSSKGARLFAKELKATVVDLEPYSEDYINSMLKIANEFSSD